MEKTYICIDLKSFYASVECVIRNKNPLTTNLVVADQSRTEKTICLAVSPTLKSLGVPSRPRLFEVIQIINNLKKKGINIDYIVAPPQMAKYIEYSTKIYSIYLRYFSNKDIHVYSIDEVFIDATHYLNTYGLNAKELTFKIIREVLKETGITATAGIAPNLYLAKVAMDIEAKHIKADTNGVRIAYLNEFLYKTRLWTHTPITDFWRIGKGYEKKLKSLGLFTMGDIARYSLDEANQLYKIFGINAELLIDHAWGYESCTMEQIKQYKPSVTSVSTGQVLHCAYSNESTKLVLKEMAESLALDLFEKKVLTNQIVLDVSYDIDNLKDKNILSLYHGDIVTDIYGRKKPKGVHASICLKDYTASVTLIKNSVINLFEKTSNPILLCRKVSITANHVLSESDLPKKRYEQLSLFELSNPVEEDKKMERLVKEKKQQEAILNIKKKFGKNSILRGIDLEEDATMKDRNSQIGGHKA